MIKVQSAFLKRGFDELTMGELAEVCGFSRRALYYHYSSKEELFRDVIRFQNEQAIYSAWTASTGALMQGADAIEVVTMLLDIRFGAVRRSVAASPHALELNDTVFRLCNDIIIDFQIRLHEDLLKMIELLESAGKIAMLPDVSRDELAMMLAAAARGVNQARPHLKDQEFRPRYHVMVKALLRGSAKLNVAKRSRSKAAVDTKSTVDSD